MNMHRGINGCSGPLHSPIMLPHRMSTQCQSPFRLVLPRHFMVVSVIIATSFAFFVGRVCRYVLLHDGQLLQSIRYYHDTSLGQSVSHHYPLHVAQPVAMIRLPQSYLAAEKIIPTGTIYTSKQFATGQAVTSDSVLTRRRATNLVPPSPTWGAELPYSMDSGAKNSAGSVSENQSCFVPLGASDAEAIGEEVGASCSSVYKTIVPGDLNHAYIRKEDSSLHEPTGQHLLVDIEHVDQDFLDSEERLASAVIALVDRSGLTLLSYHCHSLTPMGVSCVGVLLESHVSFHTWPEAGVITIDLFTCGGQSLLPLVADVEDLFGIPKAISDVSKNERVDPPRLQWALKNRGFRRDSVVEGQSGNNNHLRGDMDEMILGWIDFDMKVEVASIESDYQNIEIFDVINPRFRSLHSYLQSKNYTEDDEGNNFYHSRHSELFQPDRMLYLNKILQSRRYGEREYHEALVHPAMFVSDEPKRVAILGGGVGASLREVLKHTSVEEVTLIEIDPAVIEVSRRFLPEWSSCADIVGSQPSCFDDPRVTVHIADAIPWFISRFGDEDKVNSDMQYDVIIMDGLDPSSEAIYEGFISALTHALTEDLGVIVAPIGAAPRHHEAPREFSRKRVIDDEFLSVLEANEMLKVKEYQEGHGGMHEIWNFVVAYDDEYASERWFASEAEVEWAILDRISPTHSGSSPLHFFDGATMRSYAFPNRIVEENFCLSQASQNDHSHYHYDPHSSQLCSMGHGFDPSKDNLVESQLEVRDSIITGAGRGVFFKRAVKQGVYLAIETGVDNVIITPLRKHIIKDLKNGTGSNKWSMWESWMFGYGYSTDFYGDSGFVVDASILTFTNHGCHGSNNYGMKLSVTEATARVDKMPDELLKYELEGAVHHPYADRNHLAHIGCFDWVNRDVLAGEELTDEFLKYLHSENWAWGVDHYHSMCSGQVKGVVSGYEDGEEGQVQVDM